MATLVERRSSHPLVAIIGAPNVGKSTLFNRLVAHDRKDVAFRPRALIAPVAGTTRDRLESTCEWLGVRFRVQDTGGVDGLEDAVVTSSTTDGGGQLSRAVEAQVRAAVSDAAAVLMVVDATVGPTSADEGLAKVLRGVRRTGRAVLLVANKADTEEREQDAVEFWALGLDEPIAISAGQGRNTGELVDRIVSLLPAPDAREPASPTPAMDAWRDEVFEEAEELRREDALDEAAARLVAAAEGRQFDEAAPSVAVRATGAAGLEADGTRCDDDDAGGGEDAHGEDAYDDAEDADGEASAWSASEGAAAGEGAAASVVGAGGAAPPGASPAEPPVEMKLAVVGRPNVGKSSLVNRLLGQQRLVVDSVPRANLDRAPTYSIARTRGAAAGSLLPLSSAPVAATASTAAAAAAAAAAMAEAAAAARWLLAA